MIQWMPFAKRSNRKGKVRKLKGKKQPIQVLLFQENPNSHQSCGLTGICRKAPFKSRLTIVLPGPAQITSCFASSNMVYSSAPHSLGIWQLTERPRRYERWWILRHLPLDLGARPKGEQIKWSPTSLTLVSWSAAIWDFKSAVRVSGSLVADGKLSLIIFYFGPQYPILAPRVIMLRIVSR